MNHTSEFVVEHRRSALLLALLVALAAGIIAAYLIQMGRVSAGD